MYQLYINSFYQCLCVFIVFFLSFTLAILSCMKTKTKPKDEQVINKPISTAPKKECCLKRLFRRKQKKVVQKKQSNYKCPNCGTMMQPDQLESTSPDHQFDTESTVISSSETQPLTEQLSQPSLSATVSSGTNTPKKAVRKKVEKNRPPTPRSTTLGPLESMFGVSELPLTTVEDEILISETKKPSNVKSVTNMGSLGQSVMSVADIRSLTQMQSPKIKASDRTQSVDESRTIVYLQRKKSKEEMKESSPTQTNRSELSMDLTTRSSDDYYEDSKSYTSATSTSEFPTETVLL